MEASESIGSKSLSVYKYGMEENKPKEVIKFFSRHDWTGNLIEKETLHCKANGFLKGEQYD